MFFDTIITDRSEVRVSRQYGWVTHKATDSLIGSIRCDGPGPTGAAIWRAYSGSVSDWTNDRTSAIHKVIDLWNMQEKARVYDMAKKAGRF